MCLQTNKHNRLTKNALSNFSKGKKTKWPLPLIIITFSPFISPLSSLACSKSTLLLPVHRSIRRQSATKEILSFSLYISPIHCNVALGPGRASARAPDCVCVCEWVLSTNWMGQFMHMEYFWSINSNSENGLGSVQNPSTVSIFITHTEYAQHKLYTSLWQLNTESVMSVDICKSACALIYICVLYSLHLVIHTRMAYEMGDSLFRLLAPQWCCFPVDDGTDHRPPTDIPIQLEPILIVCDSSQSAHSFWGKLIVFGS